MAGSIIRYDPAPARPKVKLGGAFALMAVCAMSCAQYRALWVADLANRAAFELNCPKSQLTIRPLSEQTYGQTDIPLSQAVSGCGKRAVYVATKSGYVLNSDSGARIANEPEMQEPHFHPR